MPTSRRRHAVTETPRVEAALAELRLLTGDAKIEMSELVVLGAQAKVAQMRSDADDIADRRRAVADLVRSRQIPVDRHAAAEVRRKGWVHG